MASNPISSFRCMIFAIVAGSILGAAVGSEQATSRPLPKFAACKAKEEGEWCEYSPHDIETNFLFEYSHEETLKKDLREVLKWRGFEKSEWPKLLAIKSREGKFLDMSFLDLPDMFDGKVTPNDFPVKVYLSEVWKGKCVINGQRKFECLAARGSLYDACESEEEGASCTYKSLQWEKKRVNKAVPYNFKGKCAKKEDIGWCQLPTETETRIEACLGKLPGKSCMYDYGGGKSGTALYTGICVGKDQLLWCSGVKAELVWACKDKVRGEKCEVDGWKDAGWCGYTNSDLTCMNEKSSAPMPSPSDPAPSPAEGGASCTTLGKQMNKMEMMINKMAGKILGADMPKPMPKPTEKPAARRRRRGSRRRKTKA